jgi:hypothetical protein
MIEALTILLLALPPTLQPVPPEARPYLPLLRQEPVFVAWWTRTQSRNPLVDFITDTTQPTGDRQRVWQFRRKIRGMR